MRDVSQWQSIQRARLAVELEWAKRSPFFASRIGAVGRDDLDPLRKLQKIAPFRKSDAIAAGDSIRNQRVLAAREYLTSGTTGRGQERLRLSGIDDTTFLFAHVLHYQIAGLRRGDSIALTWPAGCQAGGVVLREAAELVGVHPLELGGYDTAGKIEIIRKLRPRAMVGSALYLRRLLEAAGSEPLSVDKCFIAGEGYPESWVDFIVRKGVTPFEWYGTTMLGPVAVSCECGLLQDGGRGALHVAPHMFVVDVLDSSGEQVAEGERGELVISALTRVAQPTIRYATGDSVRWLGWKVCSCGRTWPSLEAGTIARMDDMMRIRGMNVWPSAIEAVLFAHPDVRDYRGRLWVDLNGHEHADLAVEIRPTPANTIDFTRQIQEAIKARVGCSFGISVTDKAFDARVFKPRRWTDERFAGSSESPRNS